jgi:hypothetical protein
MNSRILKIENGTYTIMNGQGIIFETRAGIHSLYPRVKVERMIHNYNRSETIKLLLND